MSAEGYAATVRQVEQETFRGLLLRTAQGDRESFSTFYHLTSQRVYGVTRRILRDGELAQDVTQEVYVVVWLDAQRYDPALGSAMAWLMTIAHRRAVDKVRSEQASTNRETRWSTTNLGIEYDVVAETVADRMESQNVIQCLHGLSPLQREAIALAYYDCLTYREVAARLSVPLPTVKSRIRDGLKHLRACMDEA